jgi:hypothetical protein
MGPFAQELEKAVGMESVDGHHFLEVLIRLFIAFALGSILAYRPWRAFFRQRPSLRIETAHAQVMIAVAGAVMVAVIGDNIARAFGLVGLGGFIRFRSGIKDPRDAAVMFVMIGVGMACGLGVVPIALVATGFVSAVLLFFDATAPKRPTRQRVAILVDDGKAAMPPIQVAYPTARVMGATRLALPDRAKVVLEMDVPEGMDAATIMKALEAASVPGVREVQFVED